jgi:hypothetical protein
MVERDADLDSSKRLAAAFHSAEASERDQTSRTVRRPRDATSAGAETLPLGGSGRHLRNFVDRLFESTMPHTAAGEAAKRPRPDPNWQPPPPRFGTESSIGLLNWADARFGVVARRTPTPRVIIRWFGLIVLLTLLGFAVTSFTLSQLRDTIRTIAEDTRPAIGAAEHMRSALGAMDVDAASDSLLGDAVSTGTSREFATDVGQEIAAMVQASGDIRFGQGEAGPRLEAMQYDLQLYYGALGEARDAGRSKPWLAAQRVKFASRLLRSHVMAQADAFESGNWRELETGYTRSQQQSLRLGASYVGIGVLLVATLIAAQIFLLRRTRRLINVPLAFATLVLTAAMLWVGVAILAEHSDLQSAKTDALERLVTLRQAKSAAYAINADQAMWLIDHEANRIDYEKDFADLSRRMLDVDPADEAGLTRLEAQYASTDPASAPPRLQGLLGSVFARASEDGALRAATARTIAAFLDFLRIDSRLRALENHDDHRGALELRTGTKPDQALFAFAGMDKALDRALAMVESDFEQHIASATAITSWLEMITVSALALTLLLATAGLWQRYQEYR